MVNEVSRKMRRGFTITELLVYMAVAATALASILAIHNMGQRASTISQTNVTLQRSMRTILERVTREVRWATNLEVITEDHQDYETDHSAYDSNYIYLRLDSGNVQMLRWNQAQSAWTISHLNETGFTNVESFSVNLEIASGRELLLIEVATRDSYTQRIYEASTAVVALNGTSSEPGAFSHMIRYQPPPVLSFESGEQGQDPQPDPEPEDPQPEDPEPEPTPTLTVTSISYEPWGGSNHLRVHANVRDENNSAVSDASISIELILDGSVYSSQTESTESDGKATYTFKSISSGTYTTVVTNVAKEGFDWDGQTPANQYVK